MMTFEEIQQTIEAMLSVQRELQNSQLSLVEEHAQIMEELREMRNNIEASQANFEQRLASSQANFDRRFEQLVGYSINRERDHLDIQEDIINLKRRVSALEENR